MQAQQQHLQAGGGGGGKKGWSAKTSRDSSAAGAAAAAAATPDTHSRGTSTAYDEDGVDGAGYYSTSSKARGPNPALRRGPNDDLLLSGD